MGVAPIQRRRCFVPSPTQPNPEQAARLRDPKALVPPNRTSNVALIDFLLDVAENGIAADLAVQLKHVGDLIDKLTIAHLETTGIALDALEAVDELKERVAALEPR